MNYTKFLSENASKVEASITMAITATAAKLKSEGKPVISMSAGEPDFDTPEYIKEAAYQALREGKTKYTAASGLPQLKTIICKRIKEDRGLSYIPENISVTCGAKHAIFNALVAIINPGDEVIFASPYWVSYPDQIGLLGGKPVIITTTDATQFKITAEQLEKAITPKTKAFILNSPSNPTGMIYTKRELEALAEVIVRHDILVISDEIYSKLLYVGEHISIASFGQEIKDRTIYIDGVSKAYSMTGWRIGYSAAPKQIADVMGSIQSHSTSNPTTPSQWASIAALEADDTAIESMRKAFDERRKVMVAALNKIPGITCLSPQGAFYTFPNISSTFGKTTPAGTKLTDSAVFCTALLNEKLVACVPGSGFGAEGYLRLSYATSMDAINDAMARMGEFVGSLK